MNKENLDCMWVNSFGDKQKYLYVDRHGNPIKKDPISHPYGYEAYVLWKIKNLQLKDITSGVYSDRLFQWDCNKFNRLCEKYWGNTSQWFNLRSHKEIELFLREYLELSDLKLLMIEQMCNVSNGFPLWYFSYTKE